MTKTTEENIFAGREGYLQQISGWLQSIRKCNRKVNFTRSTGLAKKVIRLFTFYRKTCMNFLDVPHVCIRVRGGGENRLVRVGLTTPCKGNRQWTNPKTQEEEEMSRR